MNNALVKDNMTSPVVTITAETSLAEAREIMVKRKIRRLPVIENDTLIGIVSFTDVLEAKPSIAPSLSLWDITQLIAHMKVRDVMVTSVFSLDQNATIANAASAMLEHNFSGIPVTTHGKLIGMITESDIFRMLASEGRYLSVHRQHQWRSGAAA